MVLPLVNNQFAAYTARAAGVPPSWEAGMHTPACLTAAHIQAACMPSGHVAAHALRWYPALLRPSALPLPALLLRFHPNLHGDNKTHCHAGSHPRRCYTPRRVDWETMNIMRKPIYCGDGCMLGRDIPFDIAGKWGAALVPVVRQS